MYKFYNAHPQNKIVGDCYKRAICMVTGIEYKEVQLMLNRYKKITKADKANNWHKNLIPFIEKELGGR